MSKKPVGHTTSRKDSVQNKLPGVKGTVTGRISADKPNISNRPRTNTGKCLVTECKGRRGQGEIFCRRHWFSLPGPLRDEIWAAYRDGDRERSLSLISQACKQLKEKEDE